MRSNRENFRRNRELIRRNREFPFDISESLQARPRRSNGGATIVIPAEGFQPSNERSFTDRVFAPYSQRRSNCDRLVARPGWGHRDTEVRAAGESARQPRCADDQARRCGPCRHSRAAKGSSGSSVLPSHRIGMRTSESDVDDFPDGVPRYGLQQVEVGHSGIRRRRPLPRSVLARSIAAGGHSHRIFPNP